MQTQWQLIVGNVGQVYSGTNGHEAFAQFLVYRAQSKRGYGRGAGEPVTLLKGDEVHTEYAGVETQ